jgi:hypothetical protein
LYELVDTRLEAAAIVGASVSVDDSISSNAHVLEERVVAAQRGVAGIADDA